MEIVQGTFDPWTNWARCPAATEQLVRWLRDGRTLAALEQHFFRLPGSREQEIVSDACAILRWIQSQL